MPKEFISRDDLSTLVSQDQKELDTYELGPNMQYMHRVGYTKSKWRCVACARVPK